MAKWQEHPGVMDPHEYDLSGFCVGVVDRPEMLDPSKVQRGRCFDPSLASSRHSLQWLFSGS